MGADDSRLQQREAKTGALWLGSGHSGRHRSRCLEETHTHTERKREERVRDDDTKEEKQSDTSDKQTDERCRGVLTGGRCQERRARIGQAVQASRSSGVGWVNLV